MDKALQILLFLLGALLLFMGMQWATVPATIAENTGVLLVEGVGRSSLIGDLGAYFVATGLIMMLGLFTKQRIWFYSSAIVIGLTAFFARPPGCSTTLLLQQ